MAATLLVPRDCYQKTSGLRSFSQSLNSILTPILATALFAFGGINTVIAVDLATFACAFLTLLLFIRIPENGGPARRGEPADGGPQGIAWLRKARSSSLCRIPACSTCGVRL